MNSNEKITILKDKYFLNDRKKLDIMKKYGNAAAITDFAILLGGFVRFDKHYSSDGNNLEDRACYYWTRTSDGESDANMVNDDGAVLFQSVDKRSTAVRPALLSSSICNSRNGKRGKSGVLEVEYGEYPQQAVQKSLNIVLENEYKWGKLLTTGKEYTTDSRNPDEYCEGFKASQNIEYEYNGKRYVRVVARLNNNPTTISNGISVDSGDVIWVEIQPIIWLIDEKELIALAKKGLIGGIRFYKDRGRWNGDFDDTEMNQFLQTCFKKDMVSNE
ncbi:MAG: hypothetical protein RRZ92_04790, partial [Bacilli bacterium]